MYSQKVNMSGNYLRQFIIILYAVNDVFGQITAAKPIANKQYLGSPASKAYFFPWLVTVHMEYYTIPEFMGSGSILSRKWVFVSMDSFVRNHTLGQIRPFFINIQEIVLYASGVWGTPYLRPNQVGPDWLEKRRVEAVYMFSDTDRKKAAKLKFDRRSYPANLNALKRSPYGFSMSIGLINIRDDWIQAQNNIDYWFWRRITLPIPLFANREQQLQIRLEDEMERFERDPFRMRCFVGGWRQGDKRMVQHEVVYVPFEECETAYCSRDSRACQEWPVKGIHYCFQSVHYTGLCWTDQGSALYCDEIAKSVIAILTSAPTCGRYGLPGVFTLVSYALGLYEDVSRTISPLEPYTQMPKKDLELFIAPPEKDLIPVYR